ncbi:MarR family winged helix-turn-helix transcriptional regulator [Micrococcus sp. TA1]|uniref:MarR family winged helix-turn-helix transcriptional regulator n=1 Tax=Micrococcus sp. TA1 TaxID=681627 RepID=UPI00161FA3EB|nr:MarR family winged helix-turn-helix transcriptional regulator [Micrococcus sp. TA1]MBB5750385.1 DNA-binding MarR family transcriptional regulator [Micrococcus sp. TA1]
MPVPADSPASPPELGDLMHVAFRRLRRGWGEQLAPFGLTPYQFRALQAVAGGAAGGVATADAAAEGLRLKDLAERLRIAPRSATEVVDQLQDRGLVERRPDPADRRATRIVLTGDGARVREQVREERRRQAGDYFSVLSEGDRAELARILSELVRSHP